MEVNEVSKNAMGGTELMLNRIYSSIDPALLENFQIIPSRVRELQEDKIRILYLHDLPGDPESDKALNNRGWRNFHKLVFVSHWQMQAYIGRYDIPWSKCIVIQNSIEPIDVGVEKDETIRFIYHTTPHRGLDILSAVFAKLAEDHKNIHLDVYSSFKLYGWEDRDSQFKDLFDQIEAHPQMTNHGAVSNDEIREALQKSHVYAYPCTWTETSCLSLIEAMSAGLLCIHPNYGALPETASNWTVMYQFQEDKSQHAGAMYNIIKSQLPQLGSELFQSQLRNQKAYADIFYNWNTRKNQWENMLVSMLKEPRAIPKEEFIYRA